MPRINFKHQRPRCCADYHTQIIVNNNGDTLTMRLCFCPNAEFGAPCRFLPPMNIIIESHPSFSDKKDNENKS